MLPGLPLTGRGGVLLPVEDLSLRYGGTCVAINAPVLSLPPGSMATQGEMARRVRGRCLITTAVKAMRRQAIARP